MCGTGSDLKSAGDSRHETERIGLASITSSKAEQSANSLLSDDGSCQPSDVTDDDLSGGSHANVNTMHKSSGKDSTSASAAACSADSKFRSSDGRSSIRTVEKTNESAELYDSAFTKPAFALGTLNGEFVSNSDTLAELSPSVGLEERVRSSVDGAATRAGDSEENPGGGDEAVVQQSEYAIEKPTGSDDKRRSRGRTVGCSLRHRMRAFGRLFRLHGRDHSASERQVELSEDEEDNEERLADETAEAIVAQGDEWLATYDRQPELPVAGDGYAAEPVCGQQISTVSPTGGPCYMNYLISRNKAPSTLTQLIKSKKLTIFDDTVDPTRQLPPVDGLKWCKLAHEGGDVSNSSQNNNDDDLDPASSRQHDSLKPNQTAVAASPSPEVQLPAAEQKSSKLKIFTLSHRLLSQTKKSGDKPRRSGRTISESNQPAEMADDTPAAELNAEACSSDFDSNSSSRVGNDAERRSGGAISTAVKDVLDDDDSSKVPLTTSVEIVPLEPKRGVHYDDAYYYYPTDRIDNDDDELGDDEKPRNSNAKQTKSDCRPLTQIAAASRSSGEVDVRVKEVVSSPGHGSAAVTAGPGAVGGTAESNRRKPSVLKRMKAFFGRSSSSAISTTSIAADDGADQSKTGDNSSAPNFTDDSHVIRRPTCTKSATGHNTPAAASRAGYSPEHGIDPLASEAPVGVKGPLQEKYVDRLRPLSEHGAAKLSARTQRSANELGVTDAASGTTLTAAEMETTPSTVCLRDAGTSIRSVPATAEMETEAFHVSSVAKSDV